jgi:radical SAM protein with 4Fe4S-binding SPASM domain
MIEIATFPRRLEIEIASSCNLRCVYCPRRYLNNLNGFIGVQLFKRIIDEASVYPDTIIVLHRRGESLLHPKFNELLNYVTGKFKEVQMATNGTLLDEDKFASIVDALNFISFSLDAPNVYNKTRIPASYEIVKNKILKFLAFNKGKIKTQVSMVKTEKTLNEDVETFKRLWRDIVDRVRIYEEHSVDGAFGATRHPRSQRKPCVMPFYEFLVYDNGMVGRCNHDWNGEPMGDLNKNSIAQIWHSEKYEVLRNEHNCLKINDPVCKKCDSWYAEVGKQGTGDIIEKY